MGKDEFRSLAAWSGVIGAITIVLGIVQAIMGVFVWIIGAVPGILSIVLGSRLIIIRKHAMEVVQFDVENPDTQAYAIVRQITTYFKLQGVLLILSFIVQWIGR